ncbi:MAG: glycosyltransferase family 39 protein [Acidobacteria bacterium]|nr:glycosyltransferase family 39 protein [Acidobacteriota bacterium]
MRGRKKENTLAVNNGFFDMELNHEKWIRIDTILLFALILFASIILFNNLEGDTIRYIDDEALNSRHDIVLNSSNDNIFLPKDNYLSERYYHKFPLKTWIKYPILKIFGVSLTTLRILDAIMALVVVILTFLLGRLFFDRWVGFISAFILFTTKAIFINWSRTNQYDSGFLLGAISFIYFFAALYGRKKYAPVLMGLSFGFALYFKHLQALMPIIIIGCFILLIGKYKEFFRLRIWLIPLVGFGLLAIWLVPFILAHPDFIQKYIKYEWKVRVFEGYFSHADDHLYYFRNLTLLSNWLIILFPAVTFFILKLIKEKKKKQLFIVIWIAVPLILLTIAKTKLVRYKFIIYPALAMIIAWFVVYLYRKIKVTFTAKKHLLITTMVLFGLFMVFQWGNAFLYTSNSIRETHHIVSSYYEGKGQGALIWNHLGKHDFHWAEFIHLNFADRAKYSPKPLGEELRKISEFDTILTSRRRMLQALNNGEISSEEKKKILYFNHSMGYAFTFGTPKVRVGLVLCGGEAEKYLKENGVVLFPLEQPSEAVDYNIVDNAGFIRNASLNALGYEMADSRTVYFTTLLDKKIYTRNEMVKLLESYAITQDYHYNLFVRREGIDDGIIADHPWRKLLYTRLPGVLDKVQCFGMDRSGFSLIARAELKEQLSRWTFKKNISSLEQILNAIKSSSPDEIILIKRKTLVSLLSEHPDTLAGFSFVSFNAPREVFVPVARFPEKVMIILNSSSLTEEFKSAKLELTAAAPIEDLLSAKNIKSDEFIDKLSNLLFNARLPERHRLKFIKGLKDGSLTYDKIIQRLLSESAELDY